MDQRAMDRLRQRPAPDLWPEIERRLERQPVGPQPSRRQRLFTMIVALMLAGGAIAGLWLSFRPAPQPAGIRTIGEAVDLQAGAGSLWLLTCTKCTDAAVTLGTAEGKLIRIDPGTGRPIASVRVRNPGGLAVGEGGVWIANFGADTVTRIDPRTLRVIATIRLTLSHAVSPGDRRFLPLFIHLGRGAVWVDTARGALVRIDPTDNRLAPYFSYTDLPPEVTGDFAIGDGDIWVTEGALGVHRVSVANGTVTARPVVEPGLGRLAVESVAVGDLGGGQRVAVAGSWSTGNGPAQSGAVVLINPASISGDEIGTIPDWSGRVVFLQGAFWVTRSNGTILSRIERTPRGGALQIGRTVELGPSPHFFVAGEVWTVRADGTVTRISLPSP